MKNRKKFYQEPWEVLEGPPLPEVKLSHLPFLIGILLIFGGLGWYIGKHPQVQKLLQRHAWVGNHAENVDYEKPLESFTDEERKTYNVMRYGIITRHRVEYPDCQYNPAVFEDADRYARWVVADNAHRKIRDAAYAEWDALSQESPIPIDYNELVKLRERLTDAEKKALIARGEDWIKRREVAAKRYNEVSQQRPVKPKPRHIH